MVSVLIGIYSNYTLDEGDKYNMFRSFFKAFNPRHFAFLGAFASSHFLPFMATSEEHERINQKLKRKLNEKYHNRKDISFELTDEFRY